MLRRLRKIAPSMLACVAILFWGLASAVPAAHGAMAKPAPQSAQGLVHNHVHADSILADDSRADDAAVSPADTDTTTGGLDRCSPSGCSFAAMMPVPLGAIVHALVIAPAFASGADVPTSSAAPPLRPPRFS